MAGIVEMAIIVVMQYPRIKQSDYLSIGNLDINGNPYSCRPYGTNIPFLLNDLVSSQSTIERTKTSPEPVFPRVEKRQSAGKLRALFNGFS